MNNQGTGLQPDANQQQQVAMAALPGTSTHDIQDASGDTEAGNGDDEPPSTFETAIIRSSGYATVTRPGAR